MSPAALPLLLSFVLPAAGTTDELPQLLVMDLAHSDDVKPDIAKTLTELLTAEISTTDRFRVLSGADIRNLVALEGEKQAMGCESDQSCLAEVAGALGARFVIFGRVSTLGTLTVLQLNLLDAQRSTALSRVVVQAEDVAHFARELAPAAAKLLAKATDVIDAERAAAAASAKARASTDPRDEAAASTAEDAATAARDTVAVTTVAAPAPAPVDDGADAGVLHYALLGGAGGVFVVGALAGVACLAAASAVLVFVTADKSADLETRNLSKLGVYALGAVSLAATTVGVIGGGGLFAAYFFVE